jgi:hypothetical protein
MKTLNEEVSEYLKEGTLTKDLKSDYKYGKPIDEKEMYGYKNKHLLFCETATEEIKKWSVPFDEVDEQLLVKIVKQKGYTSEVESIVEIIKKRIEQDVVNKHMNSSSMYVISSGTIKCTFCSSIESYQLHLYTNDEYDEEIVETYMKWCMDNKLIGLTDSYIMYLNTSDASSYQQELESIHDNGE